MKNMECIIHSKKVHRFKGSKVQRKYNINCIQMDAIEFLSPWWERIKERGKLIPALRQGGDTNLRRDKEYIQMDACINTVNALHKKTTAPCRNRTCDPLIKSGVNGVKIR